MAATVSVKDTSYVWDKYSKSKQPLEILVHNSVNIPSLSDFNLMVY